NTAERYYLQALARLTHTVGHDHPDYAGGLAELGTLYQLQGRYTEARRAFDQARAIHEQTAEATPLAHASCLISLAFLHHPLDERRAAKADLTRARTLIEQAGAPTLDMAALKMKEAWVLCLNDGLGAVVDRAREALTAFRKCKGERSIVVLQARYQLGRLLMPLWLFDETGPLVEGLVPICRDVLGEEHPLHAAALETLGRLRMCQGELREAEDLTRRSLALTVAALGERHLDVAARHRALGTVLHAENRLTAAAESYEQALVILRHVLGEEDPKVADIRLELAAIRENGGEHCKAVEQTRAVIELLDRYPEDVRSEQAGACLALARLQSEAGELDEASSSTR